MRQTCPDSPESAGLSQIVCSTAKPGMPSKPCMNSPAESPLKSWSSSNRENTLSMRCRICLESDTNEDLVNICKCTGTMGLLHRSCLEEWLTVAQSGKCEICGFEFKIGVKPPTFYEWLVSAPDASSRRRHVWADVLCLVVMFPLVGLCCWLTIHAFKSYSSISMRWEIVCLILLFTFILSVFSTWIIIAVRFHFKSWRQWRAENGRMAVENSVIAAYPVNSQRVCLNPRNYSSSSTHQNTRTQSDSSRGMNSIGHPSRLFPPPTSPPQLSLYDSPMPNNSILAGQIRSNENSAVVVINYQPSPNQGLQIL